jgi:coenzyme F420-0:L-glutamate ligase/coenzyme F420-1:gamma-L-glutamate ligase
VAALSARSLAALPEVQTGADLAAMIVAAGGERELHDGELVVLAHKAVSKAEGAVVALSEVTPGERAVALAEQQQRDPRVIQVVLDQSQEVLRAERGVMICRTHHGFVCANAGVDASNAARGTLVLLPRDPDASARHLRARLRELTGARVAVLISDSFGRAWRHGQVDIAVGLAGMHALDDWRGRNDAGGMELRATWLAIADAAAACADLARAKDSREPAVVIDGLQRFMTEHDGPGAAALVRSLQEDMFR